MNLHTIQFFVFLLCVSVVFFGLSGKKKQLFLLLASYLFYAYANPNHLLILIGFTLVNWLVATQSKRKAQLFLGLGFNLLFLIVLKYSLFLITNIDLLFSWLDLNWTIPKLSIEQPLGISFFTLQVIALQVYIYTKPKTLKLDPISFTSYVCFFPLVLAGPIEKPENLLPQLQKKVSWDETRIISAMRLFLWGLFKKIVVADRLRHFYLTSVFVQPEAFQGYTLLFALGIYSVYLYADFSGYTDMARASARIFGIELLENFKQPYFASSVSDFWRRWHISFSDWLRKHVYFSLGGNRVSKLNWYRNILLTFLISGIWHGAAWKFVLWGFGHGFAIMIERSTQVLLPIKNKTTLDGGRLLSILTTFGVISLLWVPFWAESIEQTIVIYQNIFKPTTQFFQIPLRIWAINILGLSILLCVDVLLLKWNLDELLAKMYRPIRWSLYLGLTLLVLNFGIKAPSEFLYVNF